MPLGAAMIIILRWRAADVFHDTQAPTGRMGMGLPHSLILVGPIISALYGLALNSRILAPALNF